MTPSPQQLAVYSDVAEGEGHTLVEARAGCGKTTTIVSALEYLPPKTDALLVAFNKSIATELKTRVKSQKVEISTLHSYGLRQLTRALGRVEIDADKTRTLAKTLSKDKEVINSLVTLVSRCKGELARKPPQIDGVIDSAGIEVPETTSREELVSLTAQLLSLSAEHQQTIDFDDMIWYPNIFSLRLTDFDYVFVDETQDLNAAQLELVLGACPSGRIIAVGDPAQAIYGFRGAATDAMARMGERLEAKTLPLSVTYRCPRAVVRAVRHLVPNFEAAPSNPEGLVQEASREQMLSGAREGDFVLSRANAPLLGVCFEFLRRGVKASVAGRDIGARLKGTIGRMRTENVTQLLQKVQQWKEREISRLQKLERSTELVADTAECISVLSEGCETVTEVRQKIDRLFSDDGGAMGRVVCSSTHKAKGLERERVWMLADTYRPSKGGEESNLYYVAATRAKSELYLVRGSE